MIPLQPDSLVFKLAGGDSIPCSAEAVSFEIAGDAAGKVDKELLRNAAAAVLHYFKTECNATSISAEEFSRALEKVLHGFGLTYVNAEISSAPQLSIAETDLCALSSDGLELLFFPRLREELHRQLQRAPRVVRFRGLRDCVKQLAGSKRWSPRCQTLNDQIVEYLRSAFNAGSASRPCGLVVV